MLWLGDFPGGSDGKASVYNVRDLGLIPGLGRFSGEGNGNPLQYSCLENPMDGGAWCRLLSMGSQRVRHDWATSLSFFLSCFRCSKLKMRSFWTMVCSWSSKTRFLIRRGDTDTHTHRKHPMCWRGQDWSAVAISQGTLGMAGRSQEEVRKDSTLELSERARPCQHPDFCLLD